jgi:flagellar hook-associated protein 3 FlgL
MTAITSTSTMNNALRNALMSLQTELTQRQKELSTGVVADLGQSLGVSAGRDMALEVNREDVIAIQAGNGVVDTRLGATQTSLGSLSTVAQQLRQTLIAGQSAATGADPSTLQAQARSALAAFTATLNTNDGSSFIFGGVKNDAPPMADYFATPPSANKQAIDAAFSGAFGMSQTSAGVSAITPAQMQTFLSGPFAAQFNAPNWSNWSSASDQPMQNRISASQTADTSISANAPALRELAMGYAMLSDLGMPNLSAATAATVQAAALQHIDHAVAGLTQLQASAGAMQAGVKTANDALAVQQNFLETQIGAMENVDPATTATRVNALMTQIETSYTLTSKIQQLSLAKYL